MATGPKSYTASGNVRAPSKALCLQWVKECWEAISAEIFQKSFSVCGISVNTDKTEDEEIHCFKEGGVAADTIGQFEGTLPCLPLQQIPRVR